MPSKDEEVKGNAAKSGDAKKPKPSTRAKSGTTKAKKTDVVVVTTKAANKEPVASKVVEKSEAPAAVTPTPVTRNWKGTAVKVGVVVVGLLVVVVLLFGVLIYGYKSDNAAVKAVAQVVPYPAERVNGQFVSYSDYLFEVDANERAYQNNAKLNNQPAVDFNSADGKKLVTQIKQHALQKLESDAVVAQLASQKKVTVSDKQVNDLINQLYSRYGGKDTLLKTLNQIYGWNLNDLRGVVRKQLLEQALQTEVTSDPAMDATAKAKAEDVLKQIQGGADFSTVAKQQSQASDASGGGDLGYVAQGQLPDNEWAAAQALQPGSVSDVIKTQYGYEILKVLDKKSDGTIHVQHVLIKTVDFNSYFQEQLNKAKVDKYISV